MAMNSPAASWSRVAPVKTSCRTTPSMPFVSLISAISLSKAKAVLSSENARSGMTLEARRVERRWMTVTDLA